MHTRHCIVILQEKVNAGKDFAKKYFAKKVFSCKVLNGPYIGCKHQIKNYVINNIGNENKGRTFPDLEKVERQRI